MEEGKAGVGVRVNYLTPKFDFTRNNKLFNIRHCAGSMLPRNRRMNYFSDFPIMNPSISLPFFLLYCPFNAHLFHIFVLALFIWSVQKYV